MVTYLFILKLKYYLYNHNSFRIVFSLNIYIWWAEKTSYSKMLLRDETGLKKKILYEN